MVKTQIQLPDATHDRLRRLSDRLEVSMAELVRRGIDYVLRTQQESDSEEWELPPPIDLGAPRIAADKWREIAWMSEED